MVRRKKSLLQENHITRTFAQTLKSAWDGDINLSGQHTNKQGITLLIKSNTGITVDNLKEIMIGRQASIDITSKFVELISPANMLLDTKVLYLTLKKAFFQDKKGHNSIINR